MFICVFAAPILIEAISLDAGLAFSLFDVVVETVGVSGHTDSASAECISLFAAHTGAVFVGIALCDFAGGLGSELERIGAGNTAKLCQSLASHDVASTVAECEGRNARTARSILVNASCGFFDTLLEALAVEVAAEALDACSEFIHFVTGLIL